MKRVCIERGCSLYATRGPRCQPHTKVKEAVRVAKRGNLYGGDYQARRAACIREQPWCSVCGATQRLTADHINPGDPASPLRTLCLTHNVTRANKARARHPQGVWHRERSY